jgi:glycosyltransferase involved in cell wall biosynthesis
MKLRISKRTRIVSDELRELAKEAPNILFISADLDQLEIAALHRAADVYVSLHRSEGFGLNIYEALLLRKQVVATDWSANAEYGPRFETYNGVPYKLVPYEDWTSAYPDKNFSWAEPDEGRAALLLQNIRCLHELGHN